jgi:hypothetical protein
MNNVLRITVTGNVCKLMTVEVTFDELTLWHLTSGIPVMQREISKCQTSGIGSGHLMASYAAFM